MTDVLYHLRRAAVLFDDRGLSDGLLLEQFLTRREEVSFEVLVRRHGPMVWGVCRRLLGNTHDAEDAFQATFMVLVRKANTVRPRERVGNWLYGVAFRTAQKARTLAARRRAKEARLPPAPSQAANPCDELQPVLDGELSRLPEKYRAPIVLCDLQGKSRKEAARSLGWPEGTVSGRLARGRALLARRLTARGVTLSAVTLALALGGQAPALALPTSLVHHTVRSAMLLAAGHALTEGAIPVNILLLTDGVMKAMLLSKLKTTVSAFLAAGLFITALGAGSGPLAQRIAATEGRDQDMPLDTQPAAGPESMFPDGRTHDFGKVKRGSVPTCAFTIVNTGYKPLQLLESRVSAGCLTVSLDSKVLGPNEKTRMHVAMDTQRFVGPKRTSIFLLTQSGDTSRTFQFFVLADSQETEADNAAITVHNVPPVVVKTLPQAGDDAVDAAGTTEIRVSFSKKMKDQTWSWSQLSDETFPKTTGKPRYDADQKTCILPIKLEGGKTYALWINSQKFKNFKDADGQPAVPYLLVFQTKK